ncbi:MAG TPA: Holliday junction resolvase RuvX [Candidatus Onthousia faecigallinarum]|nr:Holliday junction resolvase RuvX [Candidatus Onthousia faecigallinarum]
MRYLGLDLGSKTIGLALSDKTGLIATSYGILRHDNDPLSCLKELKEVIAKEKVEGLVLGFPKNMNNTIGPRGEATLDFKKHLEEELSLPVYLEDERLTTKQAEDVLLLGDVSRKKRKKVIDGIAATIILQNYLDKRRK